MNQQGQKLRARMGSAITILTIGLFALAACAENPPTKPLDVPKASKARLGINLAGPADYGTELPFVDVFRLSREWISQEQGKEFGQGPKLSLDKHGWVARLEPACWAETPLCTIEGGHYPSGEYTVLYEGSGTIDVSGAASIAASKPGEIKIKVDSRGGGFFLKLMKTDPDNHVRNIRVIMPGFVETHQKNPWHPKFLERWQGVDCLRFMDLMLTNNSTIKTFDDRPKIDDATYTKKGVPVELLCDLANRVGADAWFCMPHQADDEYVRGVAKLVKERLDPKRKAYIEYSNEVWNGMFEQTKFAGDEGLKLKFADKHWEAGWRYTAHRSKQIFAIWEKEFGGRNRLVRVLASQSVVPYISEQILNFDGAGRQADALAIAPYIGFNVSPDEKPTSDEVAQWSVDQVFDHLEKTALPEAIKAMHEQKEVADKFGVRLIAYEGGQHLVGVKGGEDNEKVTELFKKTNAHERMGKLYERYFDAWIKEGGDLFCYFSSISQWSKWGSWGLLQFHDDDPRQSPKYKAVMKWAKSLGQDVRVPE